MERIKAVLISNGATIQSSIKLTNRNKTDNSDIIYIKTKSLNTDLTKVLATITNYKFDGTKYNKIKFSKNGKYIKLYIHDDFIDDTMTNLTQVSN